MLKRIKIINRIIEFIKSIFSELKFVKWIKGKDVWKYTFYMMVFLLVGSIFILILDSTLLSLRGLII